jgi:DNA adenine methylase
MYEHNELAKEFERLNNIGANVILSNSNSEYIKSLYKEYDIIKIKSLRNINCDPKKRKDHYDLIILGTHKKIKDKVPIPHIKSLNTSIAKK